MTCSRLPRAGSPSATYSRSNAAFAAFVRASASATSDRRGAGRLPERQAGSEAFSSREKSRVEFDQAGLGDPRARGGPATPRDRPGRSRPEPGSASRVALPRSAHEREATGTGLRCGCRHPRRSATVSAPPHFSARSRAIARPRPEPPAGAPVPGRSARSPAPFLGGDAAARGRAPRRTPALRAAGLELDRSGRVGDRVVEQVVEDLVDVGRVAWAVPPARRRRERRAPGRGARSLPALDRALGAASPRSTSVEPPSSILRAITSSRSTMSASRSTSVGGLELASDSGSRARSRRTRAGASSRSTAYGAGARRSPRTRAAPARCARAGRPSRRTSRPSSLDLVGAARCRPRARVRSPAPSRRAASARRVSGRRASRPGERDQQPDDQARAADPTMRPIVVRRTASFIAWIVLRDPDRADDVPSSMIGAPRRPDVVSAASSLKRICASALALPRERGHDLGPRRVA